MRLPTQLLRRKLNSNKGDFGSILVLSGSRSCSGAAVLSGYAALRSGAGLVTLGIPEGINTAIIKIKPLEVMTWPLPETKSGSLALKSFNKIQEKVNRFDVIVLGPGLTQDSSTQKLVRKLVGKIKKPLVLDADGINSLKGHLDLLLDIKRENRKNLVLTPHPKEMARLTGLSVEKIENNRKEISLDFAKRYKVTLVLKGHNTIVCDYSGNSFTNRNGNPGMATAGSGDVLTGIIAAFLGQGLDAFEAAKYGVYLHGFAGDIAAGEKTQISLIASDIIDKIPSAIKRCK
jgi:NAD(P)H-hydrate epimerase